MTDFDEVERNKSVIRRLPVLLRDPDVSAIRALFTEDFRLHDVKYPDWPTGHAGAERMFLQMHALIPDLEADIEDMFGEGDRICVRWRFKGSLSGEFMGRIGDGTPFETIIFSIYRFRDGQIAEDWGADIALPASHPWRTT